MSEGEHYPAGFHSGHHHVLHDDPVEMHDPAALCIRDGCTNEGHDRCQSCGHRLCGRHNETSGGFCGAFTSVETRLGSLPCCIRVSVIDGDIEIGVNSGMLYGDERFGDSPPERDVMRDAIADALPEWFALEAEHHLLHARDELGEANEPIAHCLHMADEVVQLFLADPDLETAVQVRDLVDEAQFGVAYHAPDQPFYSVHSRLSRAADRLDDLVTHLSGGEDA